MRKPYSWPVGGVRPLKALVVGCAFVAPLCAAASPSGGVSPPASTRGARLPPAVLIPEAAEGASGASLATGAGWVFHRTGRPVLALRSIDVAGTAIQLHTWQELQADGTRQSYTAYTRGGTEVLGRVRDTRYLVRLEGAQFDPLRVNAPLTTDLLAADRDNTLHLVQFFGTPLPEFREALEREGGKVLRFLTDHTFVVELDADARKRVAELAYVRWVGPYHPEYRLERELRDALAGLAPELAPQRYSIMVGERGATRQGEVVGLVQRLGGTVELIEPGGMRVEATLTAAQLREVARSNAVQFIDRWGGPGGMDMDIVRNLGGANYLEGLEGWTGQGVRGEVFDTELRTTHQEWANPPIIHSTGTTGSAHGTSCYSNIFGQGAVAPARGIIPSGQGIFYRYNESTQFGGTKSRYTINQELTDPNGPYRAVFQTSSVGSTQVQTYTTVSAEVDDYLFKHPILSTQSQSNMGNRNSRPQAWAKNIVSVGAFQHFNTLNRADDRWGSSGSIGPAADGRIKPDLSFFYDSIHSASNTSNTSYTQFGGTSSATPQTAGYFGLLFQMWHEGVWAGFGGQVDVFASRPQMATAKALMINNAFRYNWMAGGSNADIDRYKQGWGTSDIRRLYDRAPRTSVIDETDLVTPLGVKAYDVTVQPGETELNVTLVFTDPMGTVGAAQARINDLSLRVTAPNGTVYWGNNGLTAGNFSTSGGTSNTVDTVENVFLQSPAAGRWKVEVLGDEIVQDSHVETTALDADYGLVVSGGVIVVGDVNATGCVDADDVNLITGSIGQSVPPASPALDLTGDGIINIYDRNLALQNLGKGCP
ncbi:S8 family serine peptidase [Pyxidicoccus sp. 3LG]